MKHSLLACVLAAGCALASALVFFPPIGRGAEPAQQFLEGLRGKGYYDVALDYLDQMAQSKLAPTEFRDKVLYEQGATLLQISRIERDYKVREQRLDEARAKFKQFILAQPDHALASKANRQRGNVLVQRARIRLSEGKLSSNSARKPQLLSQARDYFAQAYKVFQSAEADTRSRLEEIPKVIDPKSDRDRWQIREQLREDHIEAQMASAMILHESATSAPSEEKKHAQFKKAAAAYEKLYKKYRRRLAGLYCRLHQGRCYQDMGDMKEALYLYGELLEQSDKDDKIRTLKTLALKLSMQCWLDESQRKYDVAMRQGGEWVKQAHASESRNPDWLELRYQLARALKLKADSLDKKDRTKSRLISEARKSANYLVRLPGPWKKKAKLLLVQMGSAEPGNNQRPTTFVDARDAGKGALEQGGQASTLIVLLQGRLSKTKEEAGRKEIQQKLAAAHTRAAASRQDALEFFRLALNLADDDVSRDDLNAARYYLTYLYYTQGDYFDAAVMGEFVSRRYPQSAGARQCALFAMAAYQKYYQQSASEEAEFVIARILSIAEYLVEKWPQSKEADDALITLINFTIRAEQLEKAQAYLEKIDPDSPRRGEAELKTGQALWSGYLRGMQQILQREQQNGPAPEDVSVEERKQQLGQMKQRAQSTLEEGIRRMRQDKLTTTLASAVLSLCQIYVDTNQTSAAIKLLEDKAIGAKTLVQAKHPAAAREGYAEVTYKTALRAYIGALAGAKDADALMGKAEDIMQTLSKTTGSTPRGQQKLIAIYISVAHQLEQQIKLAEQRDKKALSMGFEKFLKRVGQSATKFNELYWVAETFFSLGNGFETVQGHLTPEAYRYYIEAAAGYEKILALAKKDKTITPNRATQARIRLATVRRRQELFKQAMNLFETVLKKENRHLRVQLEAARTYQEWARFIPKSNDKASLYRKAVHGGRKNKKTGAMTIWGWARLAQTAARQMAIGPAAKQKYTDTFHEARYNLAVCDYQYALSLKKDPTKRSKYLLRAQKDITITASSYPSLGGPAWRAKYDRLLRKIQSKRGEKPQGLAGIKSKRPTRAK